jgi:RHS repeat-associated protein
MINSKKITLLILLFFLFIILQSHECLAQEISPSSEKGSASSGTEAASTGTTNKEITPSPEEATTEENNSSSANTKDESDKEATPETTILSTTSEADNFTGLYLRPEAVTVSQAGSATLSYPIEVPPGRGGLAPQIALHYSSSSHNGWVGVGWELSLGSIERSTKEGKPDYDNDDTFTLQMAGGSEELVKEGSEYRLKDEGAFLRLEKTVNDIWVVTAKNGTKYYLGEDDTSRLINIPFGIFRWYLKRVVDPNGNTITYHYYKDTTNNQVYPLQIDYDLDNHIKFVLDYVPRIDTPDMYNTFFKVKTLGRLKNIEVYNGGLASSNLVRRYELNYGVSPASERTRLESINHYGKSNPVPLTTSFGWQDGFNGFIDEGAWANGLIINNMPLFMVKKADFTGDGKEDMLFGPYNNGSFIGWYVWVSTGDGFEPNTSFPTPWITGVYGDVSDYRITDLNGDGKSDIVMGPDTNGDWHVMTSTGTGFVDEGAWITNAYGAWSTYAAKQKIINMDVNGDGKSDVVLGPDTNGKFYVMTSTGTSFQDNGERITTTWTNTGFPMDVNGDGKSDIVRGPDANGNWYVLISTGTGFENKGVYITGVPIGTANRTYIMDVNGDGLSDIVIGPDTNGAWRVLINTGTGFIDEGAWITGAYGNWADSADDTSCNRIYAMDVNGDGKSDIVLGPDNNGKFYVMTSKGSRFAGGAGFINQGEWVTVAYTGTGDFATPLDSNGDGLGDILLGPDSSGNIYYLSGGDPDEFPDIIDTVTTPLGATTTIEYISSSDLDNNYLPFKMQTVKSITTTDNQGHTAKKSFSYQGKVYNSLEREFYGFEEVSVTDEVTGFKTTTHYLMDDIFHGCMSWQKTVDSSGKLVSKTENTVWDKKDYGNGRYFRYVKTNIATRYNGAGNFLSNVTSRYDYDDYGNQLYQGVSTSDGINTFTRTEYLNNPTTWLLGQPQRVRVAETDPDLGGTVLRESQITYDIARPWLTYQKKAIHREGGTEYEYTTSYSYDSYGNVVTITDPRGKTTTINYDASSGMFPNVTTNAITHTITRTFYPETGNVHTETDPNNQTTTFTYDHFNRPETVTYPDTSQKIYTYHIKAPDVPGYHWTKIETTGSPVVTVYIDNFGRNTEEQISATGLPTIVSNTTYDNAGRVPSTSQPHYLNQSYYSTTNHYDSLRGYLNRQDNPDGTYKTILLTGFTEVITDERGHSRRIIKDSLGRVKEIVEPTNGVTEYGYDIFNNLIYVKDPVGNKTFIYYNDLGQKTSMDDLYMGHWEYRYDPNGNLIWQKDSENRVTIISYDDINRVYQKNYQADNRIVTHTYDQIRAGYFNKGALTTLSSPEAVYEFNYDNMGREVKETRTIDSTSYQTERQYDIAGRLEYIIYPDTGRTRYNYQYNGMGYLKEVRKQGASYPYINIQDTDYNALGQIKNSHYGNGVNTAYVYYEDGSFRLKDITTTRNGTPIQAIHYEFDEAGNIEAMDVTTHTNAAYTVNHDFIYDDLNRLKTATAICTNDTSRNYNQGYQYDLAGNMTNKTGIGGWDVLTWESDVNRPRIRPKSVRFDAEVAGIAQRNIINNQDQKPVQITYQGSTTNLYYDGVGERIKKVKGTETVIYVGGIYEVRNGQAMSYIYANGQKIVTLTNNKEYYTHSDHLGSTGIVTDETGTVVEEIGYLPFGSTLFRNTYNGSTWASAYRFTGQEFDPEYDLYNYNARLYDPIMSRFITPDTIVPDPYNPQSLNRYSYCLNNPLKYTDPSGHFWGWAEEFWNSLKGLLGSTWQEITDAFSKIGNWLSFGNVNPNANSSNGQNINGISYEEYIRQQQLGAGYVTVAPSGYDFSGKKDDVANKALDEMFSPTKNADHEYLSWLYENPDGTISYTVPILHPGGPDGGAASPPEDIESKLVGFAHSHRPRNELPDSFYKTKILEGSNMFSPGDMASAVKLSEELNVNGDAYLISVPQGDKWGYNPLSGLRYLGNINDKSEDKEN